jgi:hypothetical protein
MFTTTPTSGKCNRKNNEHARTTLRQRTSCGICNNDSRGGVIVFCKGCLKTQVHERCLGNITVQHWRCITCSACAPHFTEATHVLQLNAFASATPQQYTTWLKFVARTLTASAKSQRKTRKMNDRTYDRLFSAAHGMGITWKLWHEFTLYFTNNTQARFGTYQGAAAAVQYWYGLRATQTPSRPNPFIRRAADAQALRRSVLRILGAQDRVNAKQAIGALPIHIQWLDYVCALKYNFHYLEAIRISRTTPPTKTKILTARTHLSKAYRFARDGFYAVVAYRLCLRPNEVLKLKFSDFSKNSDTRETWTVKIRSSKNDQSHAGANLPLTDAASVGSDISHLLQRIRHVRSLLGHDIEILIGSVTAQKYSKQLATSGSILKHISTHGSYHDLVKAHASSANRDIPDWPHLTGHSFRVGGLNAMRDAFRAHGRNGTDLIHCISQYGRWKPGSLMVFHYLTESDSLLAEINASIGKISPSDAAKN